MNGVQEAGGSNPLTQTNKRKPVGVVILHNGGLLSLLFLAFPLLFSCALALSNGI
jgi:hypothetical protein